VVPTSNHLLFAGANQPARRDFGISRVRVGDVFVAVHTRETAISAFCTLTGFERSDISPQEELLVVAPLSGHFPVALRDLVLGLLPYFRIYITDWINVRHVSMEHGSFGLDDNISCVLDIVKVLRPALKIIGLCQGGVPALAATALLAGSYDLKTPSALILIAAPIDPLANPTRVAQLLRSKPLSWFEDNLITAVPECYAGGGRPVYPGSMHLVPLCAYLARRFSEGGEISMKLLFDDGADPIQFPFLDLYTSIMDLDAKFFLENTKAVFQDCLLREGALRFEGERVDPKAIRHTALLTIEGEFDDIAAPGQTSAAHSLCPSLPERFRRQMIVPKSGHFSLFYGDIWRRDVLPVVRKFCTSASAQSQSATGPHAQKYQNKTVIGYPDAA
jgi:poly(3-hydroxybutyrate) depolymerase